MSSSRAPPWIMDSLFYFRADKMASVSWTERESGVMDWLEMKKASPHQITDLYSRKRRWHGLNVWSVNSPEDSPLTHTALRALFIQENNQCSGKKTWIYLILPPVHHWHTFLCHMTLSVCDSRAGQGFYQASYLDSPGPCSFQVSWVQSSVVQWSGLWVFTLKVQV